ncbi:zf-HC2 domain-containing protein [Actinoplanes sp. NPDC000266]
MTTHATRASLTAYAAGDPGLDDATVWAIEAHLESCADCRESLAGAVPLSVTQMLDGVRLQLAPETRHGPQPVPVSSWRRRAQRWAAWGLVPWAMLTLTAVVAAFLLDRTFPDRPSLVLLLAPVAPLSGLAVAWSRRTDPAWELIAGTPRGGPELLLRRTIAVLAAVIPALAVTGWFLGESPALWLLPCLTFTAANLLLGGRIGIPRAAALLASAWLAVVAAPAVVTARPPVLIEPAAWPAWALAAVVLFALAALRAGDHRRADNWN